MNNIFDTHAHYSSRQFDADRAELLTALPAGGVVGVLECATHSGDAAQVLELAHAAPYFHAALGIHPESLIEEDAATVAVYHGDWRAELAAMRPLFADKAVAAVGEIGLDHHWPVPRQEQYDLFEAQLQLAKELDLPVSVHDREAHAEMYELLRKYKPRGALHCYSGSADDAAWLVEQGMSGALEPGFLFFGFNTPEAPGFTFTYDEYGNVVTTWMGGVNTAGEFSYSPLYMATETEYNSIGSLVTGVTDQRGKWTRYTVNDNTGLTSQAVYPNGLTMAYGYNSSHQPTSISGGGMSVGYGYDSAKRLSSITRNGMSYGFTYNKFGNPAAVTVGNQTLSTNNWSNAGDLLSTTYGNGTVYSYTYDNYGRVTQVKKNNVLQSKSDYNAKGELARFSDSASGRTT